MMQVWPGFKPCVEQMQLPGMPNQNTLIFKGAIQIKQIGQPFKVKICLAPNYYPIRAPKVYIDQNLAVSIAKAKSWIGDYNEITIPYLNQWNQNCTITEMMQFLDSLMQAEPPIEQS